MSDETIVGVDVHSVISSIEQAADGFAADLYARFAALRDLPGELARLRNSMAEASTSPSFIAKLSRLRFELSCGWIGYKNVSLIQSLGCVSKLSSDAFPAPQAIIPSAIAAQVICSGQPSGTVS